MRKVESTLTIDDGHAENVPKSTRARSRLAALSTRSPVSVIGIASEHGSAVKTACPLNVPDDGGANVMRTCCDCPALIINPGAGERSAKPGGKVVDAIVTSTIPVFTSDMICSRDDSQLPSLPKATLLAENPTRTS